jgi:hypothetical protein
MFETRAAEKRLKVFISYSRKDIAFAQRIVAALESRGLARKIITRDREPLIEHRDPVCHTAEVISHQLL